MPLTRRVTPAAIGAAAAADLGDAATLDVGTTSGTVAAGAHVAQHATGGADPITPVAIGAAAAADLGTAAALDVGTTIGTVAAGDDSRIVAGGTSLQPDAAAAAFVARSDTGTVDLSGATLTLPDAMETSLGLAGSATQPADPILALASRASVSARPLSTLYAFLGDSITVGTGATSSTKYTSQLQMLVGNDVLSNESIAGGVAGNTSAQILARVPAILAASPTPQCAILLCGTNDSSSAVTTEMFITNVLAIADLCRTAGATLIVGTVPPREAADTAENAAIRGYNLALRSALPAYGIRLADVYASLVDPTTGALASANDSGDGVHPSPAGHKSIAQAFADAITSTTYSYPWPACAAGAGLWSDPLQAVTPSTNWHIPSGSVGSAVAADGGDCPYGQWTRFTVDNSGGGSRVLKTHYISIAAGVNDGDVLSAWLIVRSSTAAALNKVQVCYSGATILEQLENFPDVGPRRIIRQVTVPAGTTDLSVRVIVDAQAGENVTVDVACVDIFNHTTGGYTDVVV